MTSNKPCPTCRCPCCQLGVLWENSNGTWTQRSLSLKYVFHSNDAHYSGGCRDKKTPGVSIPVLVWHNFVVRVFLFLLTHIFGTDSTGIENTRVIQRDSQVSVPWRLGSLTHPAGRALTSDSLVKSFLGSILSWISWQVLIMGSLTPLLFVHQLTFGLRGFSCDRLGVDCFRNISVQAITKNGYTTHC